MKVKKLVYIILFQLTFVIAKAQCPQVYDGNMTLQNHPYWISCSGGPYTLNFQSNSSWGTYTISWGDASFDDTNASYTANSIISHTYAPTVDTFIVTLNIPSLTCTMTGVVVMELPVNAAITIPIGGTTAACAPASLSFSNISTNVSQTTHFQYNFGDNSPLANYSYTNANTSISHMYLPNTVTCQTQVTLDAWNYCTFTTTSVAVLTPIDIFSKDIPAITSSDNILCWPSNVFTFSNTSAENCTAQGNNFQRRQYWKLGNYWAYNSFQDSIIPWQTIPPAAPVTVAFPFMGSFTVLLKDSSVCGVDSATVSVNIFNAPVASVVAPSGPYCVNSSITFTNNSSVGVFYKWDFGAGAGFSALPAGPQAFTYTTVGTYTVRLVAYLPFSNSCSDTSSVVINVLPSPTSSFTLSPVVGCGTLSNVSFTDTSVGATAWDWDFGNANTSTLQIPPLQTYTNFGMSTIFLTVTAANSCTSISQATINLNPLPSANFNVNSVCVNAAAQFTDASIALPPVTSYTWDYGDGSPQDFVANPVHTYTNSGIYTVSLTVFNGQCTSTTFTNNIFIVGTPTANFIATPTIGCSDLNVTFTNTSLGTTVFLWEFGDGSPNSAVSNPTHTFVNPLTSSQTITVTLVATNLSGCSDSIKETIIVYGKPLAAYTVSPKSGCWPFNVTFTNTSASFTASAWSFGNGQNSAQTNPSTTFTNAPGSSATLFPVKLIVTSSDGCLDSVVQIMTVFPRPMASFVADTPVCAPKLITFTNQSTGSISYTWNFGSSGISTSTLSNPSFQFVNLSATPQASLTQLIAQNANGCVDTLNTTIIVYPKPTIFITAQPDSGCAPLNVNFPDVNGLSTYSWTLGDGKTANTSSVSNTYLNNTGSVKSLTAQLIASDAKGCSDTATQKIKVFPTPIALFDASPLTFYLPDPGLNIVNLSTGATSYTWSFGDGATSTSTIPTHIYTIPNSYQIVLVAKNSNNCLDTFKLGSKIVVNGDTRFAMPNAFTPNTSGSPGGFYDPADLSNDVFHPNMKGVVEFKFTIYSRWGEILFDTNDTSEGWDGYYKGKLCKQDVYVWKVYAKFYDDQTVNKTGNVTLLR